MQIQLQENTDEHDLPSRRQRRHSNRPSSRRSNVVDVVLRQSRLIRRLAPALFQAYLTAVVSVCSVTSRHVVLPATVTSHVPLI